VEPETCTVCGCLVGDADRHRDWHSDLPATAPANPPDDADVGPQPPTTQAPSDPAPYTA
jgi:hypothetical protein